LWALLVVLGEKELRERETVGTGGGRETRTEGKRRDDLIRSRGMGPIGERHLMAQARIDGAGGFLSVSHLALNK
jgi:hypothetical protein